MENHWARADSSEQVIERCLNGVTLTDVTNPGVPVKTVLDWIAAGYIDNGTLNNLTLPTLTFTLERNQGGATTGPATIYQGGAAVAAVALPFIIRSAAPTIPIFTYNVPRQSGTYTRTIVFTKPNGSSEIIEKTTFTVG